MPVDELLIHSLPMPRGVVPVKRVMDIGAGIRPMQWYNPDEHICVEPFARYRAVLGAAGYTVVAGKAEEVLSEPNVPKADAIYMLDVIEHMAKDVGERVVCLAQRAARIQVVIYTPHGFLKQTGDAWGMGGHVWQMHRSGWLPEEFTGVSAKFGAGWKISLYHGSQDVKQPEGFFAIWTRSTPK